MPPALPHGAMRRAVRMRHAGIERYAGVKANGLKPRI